MFDITDSVYLNTYFRVGKAVRELRGQCSRAARSAPPWEQTELAQLDEHLAKMQASTDRLVLGLLSARTERRERQRG